MALDAVDNVHTVGEFSRTVDFDPGPGTFNLIAEGGRDAFVWKLSPTLDNVPAVSVWGAAGLVATFLIVMTIVARRPR